ncbi:hypothetical protein RM780_02650 [Streptomyces sp. DSM 44917]|uniref:wHTH-Hsp90 Na associated domain-containing protein n=1 Tax=Streptomyces boetiae TaxID=3075541 RepID=A0ABU2L2X2_9ACTN|nr:hypothetical protein [Streptomyces sp. DSM 44917]MDT0305862.1 hypothetical protein [Streptomyces sp. DSM 44917]
MSARHILAAAASLRRAPAEVAARLVALGYRLPEELVFDPAPPPALESGHG